MLPFISLLLTNPFTRRQLWQDLVDVSLFGGPWMVIGDFNAVLGAHEKSGGCPPMRLACKEFKRMSDSCDLIYLDTTGSPLYMVEWLEIARTH